MADEPEQNVVVIGKRLGYQASTGGAWGTLGPECWVSTLNWQTGVGGEPVVQTTEIVKEAGPQVFKFEDFSFVVEIPAADWERMTPAQKQAITYILKHYHESPTLVAALRHLSDEGVSVIEIRRDAEAHLLNGTTRPFGLDENGQVPAAVIDYHPISPDGRQIADGSKAIITFNLNFPMNADGASRYLIHELLHPFIPDVNGNDHGGANGVVITTGQVINEMMPTAPGGTSHSIMNVPNLTGYGGIASLGSAAGDQLAGSASDDFLAGMEGNDVLNGFSGNDTLSGGYGLDTLTAGMGSSLLLGGFDADTYIAAGSGTFFRLEDTGGVDRLRLPGSSANVVVERQGDALVLSSMSEGYSIVVADHYLGTSRIEIFEFADGSFAASYIEGLAQPEPTHCYDERGVLVPCDEFLTPIVLDLKGNGVAFSDISKSKVRFDVNHDGALDRVGWIKGNDDLILALDRNGNGKVDGPSEISFLADFAGAKSDMEGLLGFDSNRDGFLTSADASFHDFMLWNDRNGNGISEKNELVSLQEAGVTSISLEIFDRVDLDGGKAQSQILGRSTVMFSDGSEVRAYDVALHSVSSGTGLWVRRS